MPAVIVEILFLDNAEEGAMLRDPAVQHRAATVIAEAIMEFAGMPKPAEPPLVQRSTEFALQPSVARKYCVPVKAYCAKFAFSRHGQRPQPGALPVKGWSSQDFRASFIPLRRWHKAC